MPQKKSLRKIEKQQRQRQRPKKRDKTKFEKTIGSINIPDLSSEELIDHFTRMKAITPTEVANQLNLKVSMAKRLLNDLESNGVIDLVSRSHNLKIYSLHSSHIPKE